MTKSCRTHGILYCAAAFLSIGLVWAHAGHSRSANSTIATLAPAGGCNAELSMTFVGAEVVCAGDSAAAVAMRQTDAKARVRREKEQVRLKEIIVCILPVGCTPDG